MGSTRKIKEPERQFVEEKTKPTDTIDDKQETDQPLNSTDAESFEISPLNECEFVPCFRQRRINELQWRLHPRLTI